MIRYENYARKKNKNYKIVYLTLDGHKPSENSVGEKDTCHYLPISYQREILSWLDECKKESKPRLAEIIGQYIEIVKTLTMQTDKQYDEKEVVEIAVNNIEATAMLFKNKDNIFERAREKFVVEPIERFVQEIGWKISINDYRTSGYVDEDNYWLSVTPTGWKSHQVTIGQVLYPYKNPENYIGIWGKGGEKL